MYVDGGNHLTKYFINLSPYASTDESLHFVVLVCDERIGFVSSIHWVAEHEAVKLIEGNVFEVNGIAEAQRRCLRSAKSKENAEIYSEKKGP